MESQFRNLDRAIESQPMPAQFRDTKAMVSCNDCYAKSFVKYHWLGVKCAVCDSYNTAQLQILTEADEDDDVSATILPAQQPVIPPETSTGAFLLPEPRGRLSLSNGSWIRRHSSNALPISTQTQGSSSHFTAYEIPERMGRSVSPMRVNHFFGIPMTETDLTEDICSDDEEDVDFWGGGAPRSPKIPAESENGTEEDEEYSDDSMSVDDDDDDDGEEEDRMQIFGHR